MAADGEIGVIYAAFPSAAKARYFNAHYIRYLPWNTRYRVSRVGGLVNQRPHLISRGVDGLISKMI